MKIINIVKTLRNWYSYWSKFLTVIGDIQIFKWPCFAIYNPSEYEYKVHGETIRELSKVIKPGDIVLRGYDHYLDGFLIPGKYSHSGVFIGGNTVIHAVAEGVKKIDIIDFFQCDRACIVRPLIDSKEINEAINKAFSYIGKPYDFIFRPGDNNLYCHELSAMSYKQFIDIKAFYPEFMGKEIKWLSPKYLAKSFLENNKFKIIIEK